MLGNVTLFNQPEYDVNLFRASPNTTNKYTWEIKRTPNECTWESGTLRMSARGIQARSERVCGGDTVNRGFPFKTYKSRRVSTKGAEMRGEKENLLRTTGVFS